MLTGCDGDQPGVQMNLVRFVRGIGLPPLVCGNIKGLQDEYRTPTTQQGFAEKWGQDPYMVTSFADGTKISFEQAIVANATGMTVAQRGMRGADHAGHVDELTDDATTSDELERAGRRRRLRRRQQAGSGRLRAGHARRPEAAALPQPVQARRGPALQLLHALPPVPLRGAADGGPGGAVRRRDHRAARARRRSRSSPSAKRDLPAGDGARRARRLRHVRRGRAGRRHRRPTSCCRWAWPRAARSVATSPRTRCSPTPTSSCRPGASSTSCAATQAAELPVRQLARV